MTISLDSCRSFGLALYLILGWSWPFVYHTSIPFIALFGLFFLFSVALGFLSRAWVPVPLIALILCWLVGVFSLGVISQSQLFVNRTIVLPLTLLAVFILMTQGSVRRLSNMMTWFAYLALFCAWLSFFYALFGGDRSTVIPNIDGKPNSLFLFSYSNAVFGNVIRPSFIYDEPGAFSFLLFFIALFRRILGFRERETLLILFGGLITFSLTHAVLLCIYLASLKIRLAGLLFVLAIPSILILSNIEKFDFFFERFQLEDGRLQGDNRSREIDFYFESVTPEIFFVGNVNCYSHDKDVCATGPISATPFAPSYRQGLVGLIYQSMCWVVLMLIGFYHRRHLVVCVILGLMLLQRPYFSAFGYSAMISVLIILLLRVELTKRVVYGPRALSSSPERKSNHD